MNVDLPKTAMVDYFVSPSYVTKPPPVQNADLMSPRLTDLYKRLWNQTIPEERIVCSVVMDAVVEGPGLVLGSPHGLLEAGIPRSPSTYPRSFGNWRPNGKPRPVRVGVRPHRLPFPGSCAVPERGHVAAALCRPSVGVGVPRGVDREKVRTVMDRKI